VIDVGDKAIFRLVHAAARTGAAEAIKRAPDGYVCEVRPPNRSRDQNALFYAMLGAIAKSGKPVCGKPRDVDDLKVIFVSAWQMATKQFGEIVIGLEGEPVQLRRSTASLSVKEMADLITSIEAWAAQNNVELEKVK
jgi:hypothetical protein